MKVIRPFGPTIAKASMSESLVKELNDYVDKTVIDKKKNTRIGLWENVSWKCETRISIR